MKHYFSIAILMTLVACAREPLEFCYEPYREVCTNNIDLGQSLRTSTKDWVQNNLPNLESYQYEFLNKVLVPSLVEEIKWGLPLEVMTAQAILESGWDRSEWFLGNSRYQDLDFEKIDCFQFTTELQERGYATDINYTIRLNRIIKKYKLCEYAAWVKRSI